MTELSFLLELLLNHKLPKLTQTAIKTRIDEIQSSPQQLVVRSVPLIQNPMMPPIPAMAQTPEAAKALAERNALINQAISGKDEPGRTAPRKLGRQ